MSDGSEDLVPGSDPIGQSDDDESFYNHVFVRETPQYSADNESSSEEEEITSRPANNLVYRSPDTLSSRPHNELTVILIWLRVPIA